MSDTLCDMSQSDKIIELIPPPSANGRLGSVVPQSLNEDAIINKAVLRNEFLRLTENFLSMKYLLLDKNQQPKACSLEEWAAWQRLDPVLGVDYTVVGESAIGTHFISVLPHENAPCWETNVIGGIHHGLREVCGGNRDQAEQMHAMIVARS